MSLDIKEIKLKIPLRPNIIAVRMAMIKSLENTLEEFRHNKSNTRTYIVDGKGFFLCMSDSWFTL